MPCLVLRQQNTAAASDGRQPLLFGQTRAEYAAIQKSLAIARLSRRLKTRIRPNSARVPSPAEALPEYDLTPAADTGAQRSFRDPNSPVHRPDSRPKQVITPFSMALKAAGDLTASPGAPAPLRPGPAESRPQLQSDHRCAGALAVALHFSAASAATLYALPVVLEAPAARAPAPLGSFEFRMPAGSQADPQTPDWEQELRPVLRELQSPFAVSFDSVTHRRAPRLSTASASTWQTSSPRGKRLQPAESSRQR